MTYGALPSLAEVNPRGYEWIHPRERQAPTDTAGPGQDACASASVLYYCTRPAGHEGRHEADDTRHVVATWDADR